MAAEHALPRHRPPLGPSLAEHADLRYGGRLSGPGAAGRDERVGVARDDASVRDLRRAVDGPREDPPTLRAPPAARHRSARPPPRAPRGAGARPRVAVPRAAGGWRAQALPQGAAARAPLPRSSAPPRPRPLSPRPGALAGAPRPPAAPARPAPPAPRPATRTGDA